jgi:hypothetical protein
MTRPRTLFDLVRVASDTAAAAARRAARNPRPPALVLADLAPLQARLADLDAAVVTTAAQMRWNITACIERLRRAPPGPVWREVKRDCDRTNRAAAYEMQATIAERDALRRLHDQLAAELADARAR